MGTVERISEASGAPASPLAVSDEALTALMWF
jgi:hypothetical protein